MSERERWIVYPLLFLALGAALRDKIIKTTESQRIKCQGLCVFDSQDRPLLILGPEQFPEFPPGTPNMLQVDEVLCNRLDAKVVSSQKVVGSRFAAPQDSVGVLDAEVVIAKNYVLSDGRNHLKLDGRFTVPLIRFLAAMQQRLGTQILAPQSADETQPAEPEAEAPGAAEPAEAAAADAPQGAPPAETPDDAGEDAVDDAVNDSGDNGGEPPNPAVRTDN